MTDPNAQFAGSIPEHYDRGLGPVIFAPYADDLARRAAAAVHGGAVLEIACGTGILTQKLRALLPAQVPVVATDLNEPMLAYARTKIADPGIRWQQADAGALPFPDASFGAVVCQFGLMFVPDKAAALAEARRVLAPGGVLAFNVWDSFAHNPFARIAHEAIAGLFAGDAPDFYTVPFGFSDTAILRRLLAAQGFAGPAIEHLALAIASPSAAALAEGLVRGNPVSAAIRERGVSLDAATDAVAAALRAECGDHPLRSTARAVVIVARSPAPGHAH